MTGVRAGKIVAVCFLLLHLHTRPDAPLVLLANRDEAYDRPFSPPVWREPERGVLAPRDLRAGGTWLGFTRGGLLAALTNRPEPGPVDGVRSRGLLVDDALTHPSAAAALAWVEAHRQRVAYAGFNLLLADAHAAFVIRHPGAVTPLAAGAHVLTNFHDLGEVPVPAAGRPAPAEPLAETLTRLERLAADAETVLPGDHRILKRGARRGTVCSAVAALEPGGWTLRFSAGPPDRTPFRPVSG